VGYRLFSPLGCAHGALLTALRPRPCQTALQKKKSAAWPLRALLEIDTILTSERTDSGPDRARSLVRIDRILNGREDSADELAPPGRAFDTEICPGHSQRRPKYSTTFPLHPPPPFSDNATARHGETRTWHVREAPQPGANRDVWSPSLTGEGLSPRAGGGGLYPWAGIETPMARRRIGKRGSKSPLDSLNTTKGNNRAFSGVGNTVRERVESCGHRLLTMACRDCGATVSMPSSCKHRFCPQCVSTTTLKTWLDRSHVVSAFEYPSHLILSPPNVPRGQLAGAVDAMSKGFYRLKRSKLWRETISRAFVAWGLTYNAVSESWHPHFHMIIDAEWVPRGLLLDAARRAFRLERPPSLYVRRKFGKMSDLWQEVFKGTLGDALRLITRPADVLGEASAGFHGKKRHWFIGDYPPAVRHSDDFPILFLEELDRPAYSLCPGCGNRAGSLHGWDIKMSLWWSATGKFDEIRELGEFAGFRTVTVADARRIRARERAPQVARNRQLAEKLRIRREQATPLLPGLECRAPCE